MADQHFRITADALGVEKAARQVESAFSKIDKSVAKTTGIIDKIGNAAGFKRLRAEIELTERKFHDLAVMAQWTGSQISRAMSTTAVGGVHQVGSAAFHASLPGRTVADSGVGTARRRAAQFPRRQTLENAPLMGVRGLEHGQQVQNAFSAIMPLLATGAVWGSGIKMAQDENGQKATLDFLANRTGGNSNIARTLGGQSAMLRATSGADSKMLYNLMLAQMQAGETNADRAGKNARLGLDIEAAGGSASEFINALGRKGPEAAQAITEMAQSMGLQVREGANLGEVLAQLNQRFGGLSAEVETSKSSFSQLWKEIQTNLTMFGEMVSKSGPAEIASSLAAGDTARAGFINRQFNEAKGTFSENARVTERIEMESNALDRINSMRKAGQIDQKRHHELIKKVQGATPGELYDMGNRYSNNLLPALAAGQASAGMKNAAVPELSEKEKRKLERDRIVGPKASGDSRAVRVILQNNPHSPTPMGARAF